MRLGPVRGAAAAAALAVIAAACSTGNGSEEGEGATGTEEEVTLTISSWQWLEPGRGEAMWSVFEEYENEDDSVSLEQQAVTFSEYNDQLLTQLGAGSGPDLIVMTDPLFFPAVEAGFLAPLDELVPPDDVTGLLEANFLANVDGTQYGYLTEIVNFTMFYNESILEEAGASVPTNFDELLDAATAIEQETDASGFAVRHQLNEAEPWYQDFGNFIHGFEGQLSDGESLTFNHENNVQAVESFKQLYDAGVMPVGADASTMREMFAEGQVGIMIDNNAALALIIGDDEELNANVGSAPPPFPSDGTVAAAIYIGINANSENIDEAAEFLRWMLSEPVQEDWLAALGGSLAATDAAAPQEMYDDRPWLSTFHDMVDNSYGVAIPGYETQTNELGRIFMEAVADVLVRDADVNEALDAAQEQAETVAQ